LKLLRKMQLFNIITSWYYTYLQNTVTYVYVRACTLHNSTTVLASTAVFVIRVRVKMQHIFKKKWWFNLVLRVKGDGRKGRKKNKIEWAKREALRSRHWL